MLITKTSPVGIDQHIQKAQERLYAYLVKQWGENIKYDCYGRCYRNKKGTGYVAEVFKAGEEYKEVYWNDSLDAISFFGVSDKIKEGALNTANIHLVFFVNLSKLKPDIAHRADEEVRLDVFNALGKSSFGFQFQSIDLWLENVLREYPGSIRDDRLKAVDMHPVHCFRFNYLLSFNPNKNC